MLLISTASLLVQVMVTSVCMAAVPPIWTPDFILDTSAPPHSSQNNSVQSCHVAPRLQTLQLLPALLRGVFRVAYKSMQDWTPLCTRLFLSLPYCYSSNSAHLPSSLYAFYFSARVHRLCLYFLQSLTQMPSSH